MSFDLTKIALLVTIFLFNSALFSQTTVNLSSISDATVSQVSGSTPYGTPPYGNDYDMISYPWASSNNSKRFLIQFDMSQIPANSTISSAKIKLVVTNYYWATSTIGAYVVTNPWSESSVSWNSSDGQFSSVPTDQKTCVYPSQVVGNVVEWTVTADVQSMVNGNLINNGWLFKEINESTNIHSFWNFGAKENPSVSYRPVLEVIYTSNATPPIVANGSFSNVSCFSDADGSITVSPTGGNNSGYTYLWSPAPANGQGTSSISGLTPGSWSVVITDAIDNSIDVVEYFTITEPQIVTLSHLEVDLTCGSCSDGEISIVGQGGNGSYEYSINNGSTYQSSNTFTNLSAGTYTLVVRDGNGCISNTLSATLDISPPVVTGIVTNSSCGQNNGSIDISISGGAQPYQVIWNDGSLSEDVTGLAAGTYSVTIHDAIGHQTTQTFYVDEQGWNIIAGISTSTQGILYNDGTANWSDAKATSTSTIPVGSDGEFSVVLGGVGQNFAIGFSTLNYNSWDYIKYRVVNYGTQMEYYENGIWQHGINPLSGNSVLTMKKVGLNIEVYVDGILEHTSLMSVDEELEIRVQILEVNYHLDGFTSTLACGVNTNVESTQYLQPLKKLSSSYHHIQEADLNILYNQEYTSSTAMYMNYKVFNEKREVVLLGIADNSIQASVFPVLLKKGFNKVVIDCIYSLLPGAGYYVMEIINEKKEKKYLRIYLQPNTITCQ